MSSTCVRAAGLAKKIFYSATRSRRRVYNYLWVIIVFVFLIYFCCRLYSTLIIVSIVSSLDIHIPLSWLFFFCNFVPDIEIFDLTIYVRWESLVLPKIIKSIRCFVFSIFLRFFVHLPKRAFKGEIVIDLYYEKWIAHKNNCRMKK